MFCLNSILAEANFQLHRKSEDHLAFLKGSNTYWLNS